MTGIIITVINAIIIFKVSMKSKIKVNQNKISKFEWAPDDIRIEKIISAPIWVC